MAFGSRFDSLLSQLQSRLDGLETIRDEYSQMNLEQKRQSVTRALRELNQCQGNIVELDRLIQTMPMRDREFFAQDLVSSRDLQKTLLEVFKRYDEEVKREVLLEREKRNQGLDEGMVQRTNQQLKATTANLDVAIALGQDITKNQIDAINVLREDREIFEHIDSNLDKIDTEVEKGNEFADGMLGRILMNGVVTWIIAFLLFVLDCFLFWARFDERGFLYKMKH